MQSKISFGHYSRKAYIYIRQSSMDQVHNHLESQRLQYRLVERAVELGWSEPVIIDDDLGRSGSGSAVRPGFLRLLNAVEEKSVGAIFCFEASRLARNNREWYKLIDYCSYVGTLLIDLDGIYDPCNVSDRVFLGIKGTMSEYELGIFRQRAQAAIQEKAKRGELYLNMSAGYVLTADKRCEMDPNKAIQDAFHLIFKKFRELCSATQVVLWFRSEKIEIPCKPANGRMNEIIWKLPTHSTIRKVLKNPIYAGAYAFGKSKLQTRFVDGQPIKSRSKISSIDQWNVLIKDHHQAYISWDEYMANQKRLEQNTNKRGLAVKGAPKRGPALLVGLLRCRRCTQKLRVRYSGSNPSIPRYVCRGQENIGRPENCIKFRGAGIEQLVTEQVLHVIEPAAIAAAEEAERLCRQNQSEKEQSLINTLAQAEYEADRCFEQFNLIDPKNRLVAQNLENRWNDALEKVERLRQQLDQLKGEYQPLSEEERKKLYQLAEDLPSAWHHPQADSRTRKLILQTLIKEIMVDIDENNYLQVSIHWAGGKHTQHRIKRRKKGERTNHLHPDTEKIVRGLTEVARDQHIARILNLLKIQTASGKTWNELRVAAFRRKHNIPAFDPLEYEKKEWLNLEKAAEILQVFPTTVSRLIKAKILPARQVVKYSPWIIEKKHLEKPAVLNAVNELKNGKKILLTKNQKQLSLE